MNALAFHRDPRSTGQTATRHLHPAEPAATEMVEITITELVTIEERLAHEAHLGDLHPAHARRLAAATAELDRRWADHA